MLQESQRMDGMGDNYWHFHVKLRHSQNEGEAPKGRPGAKKKSWYIDEYIELYNRWTMNIDEYRM
jgi:hypothetical protein